MAGIAAWLLSMWMSGVPLEDSLSRTPLPAAVFLVWFAGIAATASALVTIMIYNFRERWFWRFLIVGSLAWLAFPPLHSLIGLFSLILLLRNRRNFPEIRDAPVPPI